MKKILPIFLSMLLCATLADAQPYASETSGSNNQTISKEATVSKRAEIFADSLVKAFEAADWNVYMNLSFPGAIKYYGGKKGYLEHVMRGRKVETDKIEQQPSTIKVLQVLTDDMDQWQAVVERKTERFLDDQQTILVTYLIGQSLDDGTNWTFFDIGMNTVENVIYMMPEVFPRLSIPEKRIVKK